MSYTFDGDPTVRHRECSDCGQTHEAVTGFVLNDGTAYAVYFADWYPHAHEAYLDVTLGPWISPDYPDQVTFGCRLGHVEGQEEPAASLVRGGAVRSDDPMLGEKLDRDAALGHPRLRDFWDVVDWLIVNDPILHENVYHVGPEA